MLLNFLRWLRQDQRTAFRTVTGRAGELSAEFGAVGPVSSLEPSGALWYRALRRLNLHHYWQSRHLRRFRQQLGDSIGLIYVNSVASGWILDLLSVDDCPVICHVHELGGAIRSVGVDNIAVLERRKPRYIAVSRAVKDCLTKEFGIPADRVEVIYGFVPGSPDDVPGAEQARKLIMQELNLPAGGKLVCGCGSIEERKGTDLFLEMARRMAHDDNGAAVHFVWVGGASDKVAAMRKEVRNEGLDRRVHFVGHKSNASFYFAASDVFLLTSREDPFPLVIMEAARCGKPIVCFRDAGGGSEFVDDDAGFCVPEFDVTAMCKSVSKLLSSPTLCEQMGAAAKRKVAAHHNLEQGAARIATRIHDALQTNAGLPHRRTGVNGELQRDVRHQAEQLKLHDVISGEGR